MQLPQMLTSCKVVKRYTKLLVLHLIMTSFVFLRRIVKIQMFLFFSNFTQTLSNCRNRSGATSTIQHRKELISIKDTVVQI